MQETEHGIGMDECPELEQFRWSSLVTGLHKGSKTNRTPGNRCFRKHYAFHEHVDFVQFIPSSNSGPWDLSN